MQANSHFFRSPKLGFRNRAFTLVEILVATAVLLVIIVVLLQITSKITDIWKSSTGKISAFQNARAAFSTLTRTIARANLNTYNDYVGHVAASPTNEVYRYVDPATFTPTQFKRTSELHFISGIASELVPGAAGTPLQNPGHVIFFQAPLGDTEVGSGYESLNRTLNSVGFYLQWGSVTGSNLMPAWLSTIIGGGQRMRLMEIVQPTEKLNIYNFTSLPTYDKEIGWLDALGKKPPTGTQRARVLAEDVLLLVIRPRLAPQDEQTVASQIGATYNASTQGSILCPNYNYDSRAWQTNYSSGKKTSTTLSSGLIGIMRNQAPSIVDVVLVCADRQSMAHLPSQKPPKDLDPPLAIQLPAGSFTDSAKLDADLASYEKTLNDAHIRYRVFRTSVDVQGAKWSSLN